MDPATAYRRFADENDRDALYERLIKVPIPDGLDLAEVTDAYLRATMVAAGIRFDHGFFRGLLASIFAKQNEDV